MTVRIHGSLVLFCMFLFCSGTKHTSSIRDGHAILHRSDRLKSVPKPIDSDVSAEQLWQWREDTRDLWFHSFDQYVAHASPWDELKPLSCGPRRWDMRERGTLDDTLGGFQLTAVDSLQALAVFGAPTRFKHVVARLVGGGGSFGSRQAAFDVDHHVEELRFDRDVNVSVFETTIRVVGGLAGAQFTLQNLDVDLGYGSTALQQSLSKKLREAAYSVLQAYPGSGAQLSHRSSKSPGAAMARRQALPFHMVNLKHGMTPSLTRDRESCTAAAATALLEFSAASHYLNEPDLVKAAMKAMRAVLERTSKVTGLPGSTVDSVSGQWRSATTGVGAGVDSFFEYLLKGGVQLGNTELLSAWDGMRVAIAKHLTHPLRVRPGILATNKSSPHGMKIDLRVHRDAQYANGGPAPRPKVVSALQAYFPGLLVLDGAVDEARALLRPLLAIWQEYGALPELWDASTGKPVHFGRDAPIRPELVESVFLVWMGTRGRASQNGSRDGDYLLKWAGAMLQPLLKWQRVKCGIAAMADVETRRLDDRMDSFALSETLKYLFWTFDEALKDRALHESREWWRSHMASNSTSTFQGQDKVHTTKCFPWSPGNSGVSMFANTELSSQSNIGNNMGEIYGMNSGGDHLKFGGETDGVFNASDWTTWAGLRGLDKSIASNHAIHEKTSSWCQWLKVRSQKPYIEIPSLPIDWTSIVLSTEGHALPVLGTTDVDNSKKQCPVPSQDQAQDSNWIDIVRLHGAKSFVEVDIQADSLAKPAVLDLLHSSSGWVAKYIQSGSIAEFIRNTGARSEKPFELPDRRIIELLNDSDIEGIDSARISCHQSSGWTTSVTCSVHIEAGPHPSLRLCRTDTQCQIVEVGLAQFVAKYESSKFSRLELAPGDRTLCDVNLTFMSENALRLLVVSRGGCTFEAKATNAFKLGFKYMVVVDDTADQEEQSKLFTMSSVSTLKNPTAQALYMSTKEACRMLEAKRSDCVLSMVASVTSAEFLGGRNSIQDSTSRVADILTEALKEQK